MAFTSSKTTKSFHVCAQSRVIPRHTPQGSKMIKMLRNIASRQDRASGPDVGRILIGKASKLVLRPAFGRPEGPF